MANVMLGGLDIATITQAVLLLNGTCLLGLILCIIIKRWWTRKALSSGRCNLPTVMWLPKFLNYHPIHDERRELGKNNYCNNTRTKKIMSGSASVSPDDYCYSTKKMGSSSITNILPRMERLNGPYGMYATVYGISMKVVHVAHPMPARMILTGETVKTKTTSHSYTQSSRIFKATNGKSSRGGMAYSLGAVKDPAYDHFGNLFGSSIFTADGHEWKSKRASVIHCLLKGSTKQESKESQRLELEANLAADNFIRLALSSSFGMSGSRRRSDCGNDSNIGNIKGGKRGGDGSAIDIGIHGIKTVNIVKILQRSTIGLIYRFLTHHDINLSLDKPDEKERIANEEHNNSDIDGHSANDNHSLRTQGNITAPIGEIIDEKLCTSSIPAEVDEYPDNHNDGDDDDSTSYTISSLGSQSNTSQPINHLSNQTIATADDDDNFYDTKKDDGTNNDNDSSCYDKPYKILSSYLEAITNIRMIILAQSRSIWFLLPRWVYRLFSPMYKEEEREMETIRKFAQCACLNAKPGSPLHLLRSRKSHNPNANNDIHDGKMVNKQLLDEAITLLFAGQDTSAATLSWTLHLLSLYPKVQERLAKEVCDAIRDDRKNTDEEEDNDSNNIGLINEKKYWKIRRKVVTKLPYLDAVIKESMRLYPVAPFVVRRLPDELTIPGNEKISKRPKDVTIPKDTLACIWIYGLHRNKKFWNRPNEFIPERWIDPNLQELDVGQRNGSFMPFAAGPRNCVGQPLAHIVLRIILAKIVSACKFHDERTDQVCKLPITDDEWVKATMHLRKDMQAGFTVLPTGGVHLKVRRRSTDE